MSAHRLLKALFFQYALAIDLHQYPFIHISIVTESDQPKISHVIIAFPRLLSFRLIDKVLTLTKHYPHFKEAMCIVFQKIIVLPNNEIFAT